MLLDATYCSGLVKPNPSGLVYDPGYWGRTGASQPSLFYPMFGPGRGGKVQDYSVFGTDGTLNGGVTWQNNLLKLDGSTGYISTNFFLNSLSEFSVFAWVYPTQGASYAFIACQWPYATNQQQWQFYLSPGPAMGFGVSSTGANSTGYEGVIPVPQSKWSHIGVSYSGSKNWFNFFLNGQLGDSHAAPYSSLHSCNLPAYIGDRYSGTALDSLYFKGNLQQFLVLPLAVTPSQAFSLYSQPWAMFGRRDVGFGQASAPPAGFPWFFDEMSGGLQTLGMVA